MAVEKLVAFFNDNTDNIDNGKNGKNRDWLYGLKKTKINPLRLMQMSLTSH